MNDGGGQERDAEKKGLQMEKGHDGAGRDGLDKSAASSPSLEEARLMEAEHFCVIQAALCTLVASASAGPLAAVRGERLVGCKANRRYLRSEISYESLACCLVNSGVVARYVESIRTRVGNLIYV